MVDPVEEKAEVGEKEKVEENNMYVIVSGSRRIWNEKVIEDAIIESGFPIDVIIHGDARGVDRLAGEWAIKRNIHTVVFKADWNEHGKRAGPIRNAEMVKYAAESCKDGGALVAIWDGESKGTFNAIYQAHRKGLKVFVRTINNPKNWKI